MSDIFCDETRTFDEDKVVEKEHEYRKCPQTNEYNSASHDGQRVVILTCKDNPTKTLVDDSKFHLYVTSKINAWRNANLTKEQIKQHPAIYPPPEVLHKIYQDALQQLNDPSKAKIGNGKERKKFLEDCKEFNINIVIKCSKKTSSTYIQ